MRNKLPQGTAAIDLKNLRRRKYYTYLGSSIRWKILDVKHIGWSAVVFASNNDEYAVFTFTLLRRFGDQYPVDHSHVCGRRRGRQLFNEVAKECEEDNRCNVLIPHTLIGRVVRTPPGDIEVTPRIGVVTSYYRGFYVLATPCSPDRRILVNATPLSPVEEMAWYSSLSPEERVWIEQALADDRRISTAAHG